MLATRIITGLVLGGAVTLAVLLLPTRAAAGILGVLWVVGAWEWAGLGGQPRAVRFVYAALAAAAMAAVLVWLPAPGLVEGVVWAAVLWWSVALAAVVTYPRPLADLGVARPLVDFGILVAGAVALLPSWILLAHVHGSVARGAWLTLLALVLVWAADVGAYAVGRWIGRAKLAPRVSPGKTWEGVAGGLAAAALVAAAAGPFLGVPRLALIGLAVVTALVSVVGDLTVSLLKRNRGLKDSGHLLPGHGGVLDRIDGLIAAVPFFVVGLDWIGVIDW